MKNNTLKDKKIFISYGHDIYSNLAKRLAEDLSKHAKSVWFDKDNIRSFNSSWPYEIEKGIEDCDIVLAMMTKHAYRRPAGVCTNEIVYASNKNKLIRPLLVEDMEIPLLLCTIQYFEINDIFDSTSCAVIESRYAERFEKLVEELSSDRADFKGYLLDIKGFLAPQNNISEIAFRTKNFVGRKWLFKIYETWEAKKDSNILFILGKPGSGKSSFLSQLILDYPNIKGIHYCRYDNAKSTKVSNIIKEWAYYLVTQEHEYAEYFGDLELQELSEMTTEELFNRLIITPLSLIKDNKKTILVAVDAIDEMPDKEAHLLLKLIKDAKDRLPYWFKLVFTSRPNPTLIEQVRIFNPITLDVDSEENLDDLREYIHNSEVLLSDADVEKIIDKSEGIIQCVIVMMETIKNGGKVDDFTNGLTGIFATNFSRFFLDNDYEPVREFLEITCAAKEPLTKDIYYEICGEYAVANALQRLGSYLNYKEGKLSLFHKSLYDWLTDCIKNSTFCVSLSSAHKAISNWIEHNKYLWKDIAYINKYGFVHLAECRQIGTIIDILNLEDTLIEDNFIDYLFDAMSGEIVDRKAVAILSELTNKVNCFDRIIARAIKVFMGRDAIDLARNFLARPYRIKYPWVEDFANLCELRLCGKWNDLIKVGEAILQFIKDDNLLLEIYEYMGDAYRLIGDHANAFFYYKLAIDNVPEYERAEKCFFSLYNYYDLRYVKGFLTEAATEIVKYGKQVEDDKYKSYKMNRLLGNIEFQKGNKDVAKQYFYITYELAQDARRPYAVAEALYSVAECLVGEDNEKANKLIMESRAISTRIRSEYNYAKTFFASVERLVNIGLWEEAILEGEKGVEMLMKVGYATGATRVKRNMAEAYYNLGEYQQTIDFAKCALLRYKERESYPIARLKSFLWILKSAKMLNKLEEYRNIDDVTDIPNLIEFPNSSLIVKNILEILHN